MDLADACKERGELKKSYDAMARDLQFRTEQVRELQEENARLHRENFEQSDLIARLRKELAAMRNELCCKCGNYRDAHNGACDGCRWNGVSDGKENT